MKVKEVCLRSFVFSFVAPIFLATVAIGLVCRWLNINWVYGYGALIALTLALSRMQDRFIHRKYELACRDCGKKPASAVFWQKKICSCGGKITVCEKEKQETGEGMK